MKLLAVLLITSFLASYNLFGNSAKPATTKANRLLVISEPSWCPPCRNLEPHLKQLKKEGYDVNTYTVAQWKKAKPKPSNLPEALKGRYGVPFVMYVKTNKKENKVVHNHGGGDRVTAAYIKRRLTK